MIIDSHTHFGKVVNFDCNSDLLLKSMTKYKIDFSFVSNLELMEFGHNYEIIPDNFQISQIEGNNKTLQLVKKYPEKFKGLFWIKPNLEGYDKWIEDYFVENRKYFSGIKMHPFHSMVSPLDEKVQGYIKLCKKLNIPFTSHTAGDEYSDPQNLFEVAKLYPNVNFVMVHMGLQTDNEKAISLISKLPNLYGDSTWVSKEKVLKAIKVCGSEKILFGTDAPIDGIDTYNKYSDMILYLKEKLNNSDFENFIYKNSKRLFSL